MHQDLWSLPGCQAWSDDHVNGTAPVPDAGAVAMALHAYSVLSGHYLDWGVISISVTNAAIIAAMVIVFVLALVVPFPHDRHGDGSQEPRP